MARKTKVKPQKRAMDVDVNDVVLFSKRRLPYRVAQRDWSRDSHILLHLVDDRSMDRVVVDHEPHALVDVA